MIASVLACGGCEDATGAADAMAPDLASATTFIAGDVLPFNIGPGERVAGAEVSILELPGRAMTTGADGHFRFDGLAVGSEVTLVMRHPDYHDIQTGTIRLDTGGADRVTFQAVTRQVYDALAALLGITPDEQGRCQMVTTVTRVGKSVYDAGAHGLEGVTVTVEPSPGAEAGPVYFNSQVLPDRSLDRTSDDGGVLLTNVPPGQYTWTAHKDGTRFAQVRMKCRPGVLVNASPPWGLQALP